MIFSELKHEIVDSHVQQLEIDDAGVILSSDNAFFAINTGDTIGQLHPFFEGIEPILSTISKTIYFPCVNLEIGEVKKIVDITILYKNDQLFLLLFDFTEHYKASHPLVQEKNEASIARNKLTFEKQLMLAKEEFKNNFLANLNHEIRNPLNNMLGFIELLGDTKLNYDQHETLKIVQRTGSHIKMLMDDILDISKIERGVMEAKHVKFNLTQVLSSIQKHFQLKYQFSPVQFAVNVEENVHKTLIGDPVKLKQILLNLVENAFRNTQKGAVTLNISESPKEDKTDINTDIVFTLSDSGNGIPKEKIDKVFDSYFQLQLGKLKPVGEGLGLKIVKDLVMLLNGTITVFSEENEGSTFTCAIPFEMRKAGRPKRTVEKGSGIVLSKRILIAEEDSTSQMLFMKTFLNNDHGFMIEIANSGQQTLDLLEKKAYQLVILKTSLPDIDAISLLSLIKNHESEAIQNTPVLVASGSTLLEEQEKIKNAGASHFLAKPYSKRELFNTIEQAIK